MTIHEIYGFADTDVETVYEYVEHILGTQLVAAHSTYRGGDYYRSELESTEEITLQSNFDPVEHEWAEEEFQDYAVLLYISVATIGRANQIRDRFVSDTFAIRHLQRNET